MALEMVESNVNMVTLRSSEHSAYVPGDHQLFVRGDDSDDDRAARCRDDIVIRRVVCAIQLHAEVTEARANPFADRWRVLADATGENERVDPVEDCREGADVLSRDVAEQLDRFDGGRGDWLPEEIPNIAADS